MLIERLKVNSKHWPSKVVCLYFDCTRHSHSCHVLLLASCGLNCESTFVFGWLLWVDKFQRGFFQHKIAMSLWTSFVVFSSFINAWCIYCTFTKRDHSLTLTVWTSFFQGKSISFCNGRLWVKTIRRATTWHKKKKWKKANEREKKTSE